MFLRRLIWIGLIPAAIYIYCQFYYSGHPAARFSHYGVQLFFLVFAAISLASAAKNEREPSLARIWGFLAAGTVIWSFTTLLEILETLLKQPSYGTVADGFWLAGYVPMLSGMKLAAMRGGSTTTSATQKVGILWLAFAGTVIVFGFLFVRSETDTTFLLILALLYHLADILLAYWALMAALRENTEWLRVPMKYLLFAFFLMYLVTLVVIFQRFTAPLHLWSALGVTPAYILLFAAGRRAAAGSLTQSPEGAKS